MSVSPREQLPTLRRRQTRAATDAGTSDPALSDDFAECWSEICSVPTGLITSLVKSAQSQGYCARRDPRLLAVAPVSMINKFCYPQLSGQAAHAGDINDNACIATLADIFYRTIYHREAAQP